MSGYFPNLSKGQASSYYDLEIEDVSLKHEMDGGYAFSRARHTRRPRKRFTTGFSNIPDSDKNKLIAFYESQRGGSESFSWVDPATLLTHTVRFADNLRFTYAGMGGVNRYNVEIKLEQV